jgi:hypothetical protein
MMPSDRREALVTRRAADDHRRRMLVIRDAQMAAFDAAHARRLRRSLELHARRCFPRQCEALGDDGLAVRVEGARLEAIGEGLASERGVFCWLDLTLVFGPGFADDPALPWVRPLLRDTASQPEALRVEGLFRAARTWLRATPLSAEDAPG